MEVRRQSLLRLVEERALAKKKEEEKRKQESELVPYLPPESISSILVLLPLGALRRSTFVCKSWLKMINEEKFVRHHLRLSETVFIFTAPMERDRRSNNNDSAVSIFPENPNSVSVEAKLQESHSTAIILEIPLVRRASKLYIKFAEVGSIEDKECGFHFGEYGISCLGAIRASCDGLILLDNRVKEGGIVVMNPVTRKLLPLPLGTLSARHNESYGFSGFKVVHLFRDSLGHDNCEVVSVGERSWREIDGPDFGLLSWFGYDPVYAIGALHWIPHIDHNDYVVSMQVDKEKFRKTSLPKSGRTYDRIVELNGLLAFVTHEGFGQIDVWVLKGLSDDNDDELWTKQHSITRGSVLDMVPFCTRRIEGDLVFKRDEKPCSLYFYNFKLQRMREVKMAKKGIRGYDSYFPHVNSLISW